MQAKDIPDVDLLRVVDRLSKAKAVATECCWVSTWDVFAAMPAVPKKVVFEKLRRLVKRRLLDGHACGTAAVPCRGDFWLMPAGHELLGNAPPPPDDGSGFRGLLSLQPLTTS